MRGAFFRASDTFRKKISRRGTRLVFGSDASFTKRLQPNVYPGRERWSIRGGVLCYHFESENVRDLPAHEWWELLRLENRVASARC